MVNQTHLFIDRLNDTDTGNYECRATSRKHTASTLYDVQMECE